MGLTGIDSEKEIEKDFKSHKRQNHKSKLRPCTGSCGCIVGKPWKSLGLFLSLHCNMSEDAPQSAPIGIPSGVKSYGQKWRGIVLSRF
jgi:hypothetical protein